MDKRIGGWNDLSVIELSLSVIAVGKIDDFLWIEFHSDSLSFMSEMGGPWMVPMRI